jgi:predicted dehydrogenase
MGLVYAEAFATQTGSAELVAITGGSRAPKLADEYAVSSSPSLERMLAEHDIDAVLIATPHTTHLPYTRLAAAAGKHVYCEKPMAVTVEECDAMIAACRDAGVALTVAAQARYNPIIRAAKDLIDAGEIGEVRMIRVLSSTVGWDIEDGSWIEDPDEGGAFLDWGVHGMDVLSWFTGARASRVFATFANYGATKVADVSAMAQYEMSSGAMVQVWMSYEFPPPGLGTNMQLMIVGSEAMLEVDRYYVRLGKGDGWTTVAEMEGWNWLDDPKNPRRIATSAGQLEEFSRNVLDGARPSVTGENARDAVQMIDYARRSAHRHAALDIDLREAADG